MADFTYKIDTVNMDGLDDFERIDVCLRTLISAVEGTIPGSRGFGMEIENSDLQPYDARNDFAADLDEKVEEFLPEIRIADIDFTSEDGVMNLSLHVEGNEDYDDDEDEDEDE